MSISPLNFGAMTVAEVLAHKGKPVYYCYKLRPNLPLVVGKTLVPQDKDDEINRLSSVLGKVNGKTVSVSLGDLFSDRQDPEIGNLKDAPTSIWAKLGWGLISLGQKLVN